MTYWEFDLPKDGTSNPDLSDAYMISRRLEVKNLRIEELSYLAAIAFRANNPEMAAQFLAERDLIL